MGKLVRWLALMVWAGGILAACGPESSEEAAADHAPTPAASGPPTPVAEETIGLETGEPANFHGEIDLTGAGRAELELDDNYLEPTLLFGSSGQRITLDLLNTGENIHNLSLPEQSVDRDLVIGATAEIELVFPEAGAVTIFCKYHAELGMRGELRVAG